MEHKEKCIKCRHQCCKWIGLTYAGLDGKALEFYIARGCKILRCDPENGESIYRIYVPFTCPHLIEGEGCGIYERRPLACIEYEGKVDPIVKCLEE